MHLTYQRVKLSNAACKGSGKQNTTEKVGIGEWTNGETGKERPKYSSLRRHMVLGIEIHFTEQSNVGKLACCNRRVGYKTQIKGQNGQNGQIGQNGQVGTEECNFQNVGTDNSRLGLKIRFTHHSTWWVNVINAADWGRVGKKLEHR
jgi:hypothetical protein